MLTNNTIKNIDPVEWFFLRLSMVLEPLQEHVMQAKYQTIDYNYIPTPCGVINCHQGTTRLAERNKLDKIDVLFFRAFHLERIYDINDHDNVEMQFMTKTCNMSISID